MGIILGIDHRCDNVRNIYIYIYYVYIYVNVLKTTILSSQWAWHLHWDEYKMLFAIILQWLEWFAGSSGNNDILRLTGMIKECIKLLCVFAFLSRQGTCLPPLYVLLMAVNICRNYLGFAVIDPYDESFWEKNTFAFRNIPRHWHFTDCWNSLPRKTDIIIAQSVPTGQGIGSHGIDSVCLEYSGFSRRIILSMDKEQDI